MINIDTILSAKKFLNKAFENIDMTDLMYTSSASEIDYTQYYIDELICDVEATWIRHGASKIVLYFDDFSEDYVFKIPFKGSISVDYDFDTFEFIPYGTNDYEYAGINNYNNWDYCETESKIYLKSCKNKINVFFAQTSFIGYIFGIPFYISEKVTTNFDFYEFSSDSHSKNCALSEEIFDIKGNKFCPLRPLAISAFIESYGCQKTCNLIDFLIINDINDLHSFNFGLKDNKIVIIDYSGFND